MGIGDEPCKVIDIRFFKNGKHGHAKYVFTGIDLITDKKRSTAVKSRQQIKVPIVTKHQCTLMDIERDYISLLDVSGDVIDDVRLPKGDLREELIQAFEDDEVAQVSVTIVTAIEKHRFFDF